MISVINPITLLSRGGKHIFPHHLKEDNQSVCDFSWNLTTCIVHVKKTIYMYMNKQYKKHVYSILTLFFMIKVMYKTSTKKLTILTLVTTQMN